MGNEASGSRGKAGAATCEGCNKQISARDTRYRKCAFLQCMRVFCGDCKSDWMWDHGKGQYFCGDHHFAASNDEAAAADPRSATASAAQMARRQPPSARAAAVKRNQPPTPAMTPGGSEDYRLADGAHKRLDQSATPLGLGDGSNGFGDDLNMNDVFASMPQEPAGLTSDYAAAPPPPGSFPQPQPPPGARRSVASSRKAADLLSRESEHASPNTAAAAAMAAQSAAMAMSQSFSGFSNGTGGTGSINSVDLLNKMLETRGDAGLMLHGDLDMNPDGSAVRPKFWLPEEDERLRQAVRQYGAKHWKTIATFVPGRTHVQCLQRWNKVLKPGLRKGAWSEEEDMTLSRLVQVQGDGTNWSEVAEAIPGRSAKQCRERWSFNLDPQINKGDWRDEEDEILLQKQVEVGNKWSIIAASLPGRTENAIKTRYKSILRAKRREWRPSEDALLLSYQRDMGNRWDDIAGKLPNRTKNAVKTRFKFLTEDAVTMTSKTSSVRPPGAVHASSSSSNHNTSSSSSAAFQEDGADMTIPVPPTAAQAAAAHRNVKAEDDARFMADARERRNTLQRTGACQSSKLAASSSDARARARIAAAATAAAAESAAEQALHHHQQQQQQHQQQQQQYMHPQHGMLPVYQMPHAYGYANGQPVQMMHPHQYPPAGFVAQGYPPPYGPANPEGMGPRFHPASFSQQQQQQQQQHASMSGGSGGNGQSLPSLPSLGPMSMASNRSAQHSTRDSRVMLSEMLEDLANMDFEQLDPSLTHASSGGQAAAPFSAGGGNNGDRGFTPGSSNFTPQAMQQQLRGGAQQPADVQQQTAGRTKHEQQRTQQQQQSASYNSALDDLDLDGIMNQ